MIKNTEIITAEKSRLDVTLNFLMKKNETKNITIKQYLVHNGINETIIASQGRYEINKPNKLITLLKGYFYKNIINIYLKCNNIPILWRIFFSRIANNRDYVCNFCDSPYNSFHQHCRE